MLLKGKFSTFEAEWLLRQQEKVVAASEREKLRKAKWEEREKLLKERIAQRAKVEKYLIFNAAFVLFAEFFRI
jgi:hypothetical protein